MASKPTPPTSPSLLLGYRLAKVAAVAGGLPATLLCLMASVGALTDNGYARVLIAGRCRLRAAARRRRSAAPGRSGARSGRGHRHLRGLLAGGPVRDRSPRQRADGAA